LNRAFLLAQAPDLDDIWEVGDGFQISGSGLDSTEEDSNVLPVIRIPPVEGPPATLDVGNLNPIARNEGTLRERPTPNDGIQFSFTRGQKQPVVIDPSLKQSGDSIINNPQVYSDFHHHGGFLFRVNPIGRPQDEYLVDGGDHGLQVSIRGHWEIRNLNPEDTIVHYDTLDNRRLVEKSNTVSIYSPRFGTVRQIHGAVEAVEWQHFAESQSRSFVLTASDRMNIGSTEQNETTGYARANILLRSANTGANTGTIGQHASPMTYQNQEVTASLSQLLTHSTFTGTELLFLAEAKRAAVAWEGIDHLEGNVGGRTAQAMIGLKTPEAVYTLAEPETTAKLRLFKVASKETAQRGEIVEFMIRFDNVGSEVVGNVTIADSLTARLEYINGSSGSSQPAEFFIEPNEVGSNILRWEITEPLQPGDFGVVRFRCRVQ